MREGPPAGRPSYLRVTTTLRRHDDAHLDICSDLLALAATTLTWPAPAVHADDGDKAYLAWLSTHRAVRAKMPRRASGSIASRGTTALR